MFTSKFTDKLARGWPGNGQLKTGGGADFLMAAYAQENREALSDAREQLNGPSQPVKMKYKNMNFQAPDFYDDVWRHPPSLRPGDTIGVAAPAGPFDMALFHQSADLLRSMGYHVRVPEGLFERTGYLAGSDRLRADILNALFADASVQAIFCARGGYGSLRLLPLLDWQTICRNPKIFVGYSDISCLLSVLNRRCRMVVFHGPVMVALAEADAASISALFSMLTAECPLALTPERPVVVQPGTAAGRVSGGNLCSLSHMTGTPFASGYKDQILLLEDINEPPYKIDRMLMQMKMAGRFEGIRGVLLGTFEGFAGSDEEIYKIVDEAFSEYRIPILGGFDVGHRFPNLTIPLGVEAVLDAEAGSLSFSAPGVS